MAKNNLNKEEKNKIVERLLFLDSFNGCQEIKRLEVTNNLIELETEKDLLHFYKVENLVLLDYFNNQEDVFGFEVEERILEKLFNSSNFEEMKIYVEKASKVGAIFDVAIDALDKVFQEHQDEIKILEKSGVFGETLQEEELELEMEKLFQALMKIDFK